MPAFHYHAINDSGKEERGVLEADSEKQARATLRERGLTPIALRDALQQRMRLSQRLLSLYKRPSALSSQALALFTRQFATLLAAGLPLDEALLAVAEQTEQTAIKGIVLSVRARVVEGHALASAMREMPQAFSPLFCASIAAGEKSGHLDAILLRLADYTEQQAALRKKLQTALIYPAMIVLVACSIVGFLLAYVVPKMVAVYSNLHQTLPWMTRVLILISDALRSYGWMVALALGLAVSVFMRALKKQPGLQARMHAWLLNVPMLGRALQTANTARFSRTLSILSTAGVSVLEAMTIASQLITMIPIRQAVSIAVNQVKEGASIHRALKQTRYFTPMSVHMMASGEASGELDTMLERVAVMQEADIARWIELGLALFEPAVILLMGAVVMFIVLAVLLPIFELNQFS